MQASLEGDPAQLSDDEDWSNISDFSDEAWTKTKEDLRENHAQLLSAIARVDESKLDQPIMTHATIPFSSIYVTLHGGVQHDLYHAGQIAMLKKALEGVAS